MKLGVISVDLHYCKPYPLLMLLMHLQLVDAYNQGSLVTERTIMSTHTSQMALAQLFQTLKQRTYSKHSHQLQ